MKIIANYVLISLISLIHLSTAAMKNEETLEKKLSNTQEKLKEISYAPNKRNSIDQRKQESKKSTNHYLNRNSWQQSLVEKTSSGRYTTDEIFNSFNKYTLHSPKAGVLYSKDGDPITSISALHDYTEINTKYFTKKWNSIWIHIFDNPKNFTVKNADGNTLLHLAAKFGWRDVVSHIISHMSMPKNKLDINFGSTDLYVAVTKQNVKKVKELLETGVNPNGAINNAGDTPLTICIRTIQIKRLDKTSNIYNNFLTIKRMLEVAGAQEATPLYHAINNMYQRKQFNFWLKKTNSEKIIDLLIRYKPNKYEEQIHTRLDVRDWKGNTPLHIAVSKKLTRLTPFLLLQDLNVNAQRLDGYTPLHIAAENNETETVKWLLKCSQINLALQTADGKIAADLTSSKAIGTLLED